jgi:hypothetical protein
LFPALNGKKEKKRFTRFSLSIFFASVVRHNGEILDGRVIFSYVVGVKLKMGEVMDCGGVGKVCWKLVGELKRILRRLGLLEVFKTTL